MIPQNYFLSSAVCAFVVFSWSKYIACKSLLYGGRTASVMCLEYSFGICPVLTAFDKFRSRILSNLLGSKALLHIELVNLVPALVNDCIESGLKYCQLLSDFNSQLNRYPCRWVLQHSACEGKQRELYIG
jgi:hypothetical protein